MVADSNQNTSQKELVEEKIKRMHKIYDEFLLELNELEVKRDEIIKRLVDTQDEEKMEKLLSHIKDIKE